MQHTRNHPSEPRPLHQNPGHSIRTRNGCSTPGTNQNPGHSIRTRNGCSTPGTPTDQERNGCSTPGITHQNPGHSIRTRIAMDEAHQAPIRTQATPSEPATDAAHQEHPLNPDRNRCSTPGITHQNPGHSIRTQATPSEPATDAAHQEPIRTKATPSEPAMDEAHQAQQVRKKIALFFKKNCDIVCSLKNKSYICIRKTNKNGRRPGSRQIKNIQYERIRFIIFCSRCSG